MSIIEKIITKSNSHQITTKIKQFTMIHQEIYGTCPNANRKHIGSKFGNIFPFLITIKITVINVIRYQLKPLKCSFISA